ncbi:endonuclease-reverse transcriptase domain-containing protein [Hirsutella rhossiliensis]|uniref:Endonuclease-reverse transcriptase domain-containing protein n=1 Tax=Hirsutella rhossiliensis TaxID=111463 RepID=A0A9P8MWK6_9HYPO|nr:endonuclease-reverse transcriptase domain-containing protein [Hirsutella rhossiliensis]KAH0962514.1 endonuclease-reverse transcriptase domain-containing protein [Hirsutella rhossiliensis]
MRPRAPKRVSTRTTRVISVGNESERGDEVKSRSNAETAKSMMQRVLEMLAKMGSEMVELKHRVSEQSDTIRKLSATVYKQSTIIQGQEDLIRGLEAQVQESKEEFRQRLVGVKEQLHQLMQKLDVSGEVTLPSGPRTTFADVARALPNRPPSSTRSIPGPTKQQTTNESVHCTIDTSRVSESNRNKAQIGQIRQAIEVEMRAKNGHETWRCAAVVRESRNADRVKIVCRDEAELQLVKEAAQKTAVEGARVMRDQLYPVRVDNANRTAILDTEGNVLPGAIEALSAENRVTIGKISWLSKRESGKAYGSMVVYVTKKSDAERLLDGYYFDLAGESATTYTFEPRTGPIQCFNCQEIGHKQSLMNDEDLKDFVALAISEPHARNIDGKVVTSPMGHRNWTKMIPTCVRDASWPIRSMLWIRIRLERREVMVVSVYVEGKNDEALASAMEVLRDVIDRFRNGTGNRTDMVLAGDFNRHDLLWGGDEVSARRQGEGQPIVDLMDDVGLCSLLPRGTKTWQGPDKESTIDLVLASAELADEVISCVIHPTEHGSDHRAIQTTFDIQVPERMFPQRLLLRNAPWVAIAARVEDELRPLPWNVGVQTQADQLMRVVTKVLHDLTPRAQPPPYAKRWAQRRAGQSRPDLEQRAKEAAKEYHDNLRRQKKAHWDDFVTDESNIWKAVKYVKSGTEMTDDKVPPLKRADGSITEGKGEQAEELLSTFFPPLPTRIEPEGERPQREEIAMPDLTLQEIEDKVMAAKPWKAPGEDGLPAMVWKKLWHVVKVRIIPLRKPVVAERISYAVEAHGLLPANHFGARKRRSADQALVLLQERIYKAWRMGRVLSLISFDDESKGIPDRLVVWMDAFCSERTASVVVNGIATVASGFSFFNADLVQRRISNNGGSIAFVDDYSAWVTGPTAESNRDGIQSIIEDALDWEKRSGNDIKPKKNVKLLGVIMDKALRFKEHIASAAAKGLAAAMCLKRLKMASPRMARQLAQRIGAQAVTGGFRTVATAVAEAEAGVQSVRERHTQAATKFWIRMRTLPKTHPLTSLRLKLNRRYASPMQKLASAMGRIDTKRLEVIHEFALAPWRTECR